MDLPNSVRTRFLVSFFANGLRSVFSFFTGLVIARGLGPASYGELAFLLGSFAAVRSLLDLGTSNAFYTFISQKRRPAHYYTYYGLWLVFQFALTAAAVAFLLPDALVSKVWLGQGRGTILLAFAAVFFQQQIWLTVNQVAEAARKTVKAQVLNVALALAYLAAAALLAYLNLLSVSAVLLLLVLLYLAASAAAARVLGPLEPPADAADGGITPGRMFAKYRDYCAPLVTLSLVNFLYEFSDKWMLQFFGGAGQQGFYQAAYQFAIISILATTSILNIFWKEMAEATRLKDTARIERMFRKVSRGLYMFGAVLSGFLIPWSAEIIGVFLGKAYFAAGPVLGLLLLFPVHQSLGQIAGTMFLAGERTKEYMVISSAWMLLSLPISYLLQAPAQGVAVPGLGLGALGMAIKMVGLNIISVNILLWFIARHHKWRFDFWYQAVGLGAMLAAGWLVKSGTAALFGGLAGAGKLQLLPPFLLSACLFAALAGGVLWLMPWLAGLDRAELRAYAAKLRRRA